MSIIGSAWGQETGTLTMDASKKVDFTTISSEDGQIQLSFDLGTEEQIESSQRGIQYDSGKSAYKFRKTYGVGIITPLNNGVVVNEVKLTIHSNGRDFNYFVGESDTPTLKSCVENDGVTTNTFTNNNSESEVVRFALANDNNCYVSKIEVTYTYTPEYSTNANASVLSIGSGSATATNANIFTYKSCDITINGQLIDTGYDQSYVTLKVIPSVSGTYSFTSKIATDIADRYVTFSCEDADGNAVTVENGTKNITSNSWTEGNNYTWTAVLESGKTYVIKLLTGYTNENDNPCTVNIYDMTIVRTPDKTGLIQIPVDMLNISANTTAGDGFDRFYRGVNLNFAGNAVVSAEKNMVTLGAATDKLAAGSITVTVPDQTDAEGEYIQQVQFDVDGGIITDDNKTTLLKVYNGDTEITGGTWNANGTGRLIWDAPADVRTLSLKFVDNADEANTPAIKQVRVNVYEVKTLANSGRLETVMPAFSKSEVSMRNSGVKYTNSLGKVKVNGSEYNNFEVLYTFDTDDTEITENEKDGRTYYSITPAPVTTDPVTGSTIDPATGQVTTGATAGTVKVIAYYDGLQEGSADNANYAYNPVKAEYTLNVVAPAVIEIGNDEAVAKNIHVQEYGNCSINGTWLDGQLMDSSTNGAYVTFKVKPTVDGTYTFTSEIGTVNDERTITLSCNDGSSDIFTETKDITNNGNWTNDLGTYTWTVPGLEAGTEYTIKLQGNKKSDVGNNYIVNLYPMTIVRVVTATTTIFNVSDFNYANQSSSKEQNLDRTIGGFSFTYTGGEAIKYNSDGDFFFRGKKTDGTNYQGTLTIAPTDANNKITQIVIGSKTDVSAVNGFTVTADGNPVTPVLADGSITIEVPAGASSVVISTNELSASVNISSYTINTTDQPSKELYQPDFAFDHASLTVAKTGGVSNALTTTPKNYPVTFNSSNTAVATVNAEGEVTLGAAGTATITVSSTATEYFNAANASYNLTVVDDESVAGETWDFTTWTDDDITKVKNDDANWEENSNGYHKNKTGTSSGPTDFDLDEFEGLLISTTGSDQIRIYPNTDGQTDGSIRLQSKNAKIYMPALTAGQTITLTMMTTSASSARGMVFSGAGADKVQLIYGAETSKEMNVVTYRVTGDINAEELIMSASTGGLNLYSIKLSYSDLYWTDGSNTVTDVAVTAAGETSYTLNSATGASYTITDANGNESTDVAVNNNGKVVVNTFTLGKTHTITATVDGHSATLTLRMVNTASISYEQTTAEGTLGFSFVEPVLTKNPEGLNVVKWKSSNPEVATVVADNGEVTFVSKGTTTITAYIEANNYYAYTDASYELTVNEKPEMVEPWTLSLVTAGAASVATGSTGHKLTMDKTGTIQAGQVTNAIPGLTLSFGKTGGSNWNVAQENDHFGGKYVAATDTVTLAKDSYLPTGGAYLGLEPTVNGVLSLHTAYYRLQGVVVVDKETNTVVAQRRATDDNHYEDYEFTVPLQADRTYYVYNIGNSKEGTDHLKYGMPVNAITFTPVFLDRIGHVIVKNNEYNITGAQLADDIHDYPTFSNVHAEEGGSVHYESSSDVIYLDEDGNLVIDGEGTATLQAHVSHKKTVDGNEQDCHSIARCTVTYAKSQLKFSKSSYTNVDVNQLAGFEEPTLNYIPESGVTYNISGTGAAIEEDGNITALDEGTNVTVTATIADNLYYTSSASYTITTIEGTVPLTLTSEITLPVGTRGYDLLTNGHVTVNLTEDDLKLLSSDSSNPENFYSDIEKKNLRGKFYWNGITKPENIDKYASTDPAIAYVNNSYRIDAKTTGTVTLRLRTNKMYLWDEDKENITKNYAETYFEIKVNVVPEEVTDEYLNDATYRTWNFHNGFDATELSSYDNDYTALGNSTEAAENFITHIPSGHDFWIYDSEKNTLKSNTVMTVTDNKIDRNTVAFIANEPMNDLSLTSTATNCFASSEGKINDYRESGTEPTYQYDDDDKNVLTFYTFRNAKNNWEGTSSLNQVSDITFNAQTNMCGITGVDKDEHVTPYRSIQLSGKAAFIRVNDIKPGMWMSVIADNNNNKGVAFVQLASDGAEVQAMGQSLYSSYSDSKDADLTKYPYNRVTNVFPYLQSAGTTVAIEQEGATGITNIMVGYPAGMGTLNVGGGEKSPNINNIQRTYGYATFVSPYNIDLTGQTALKAYICDYYGKDNNLVHMVQIKHIPANTPVMLKGYARDKYVLYISEGNKDVEHGISEEVFAKNRLVGAMEDGMMVQPTEEGIHNGAVTTWHNMGLTQNKFLTFTVASPIAKGRAYLRITQEEYEDLYAAHVSASAASTSTKIVFEDTDFDYSSDVTTPTGIENLENVTVTVGDGHYYNLNGVRVNGIPTQKGIYIRNGKKIVVR